MIVIIVTLVVIIVVLCLIPCTSCIDAKIKAAGVTRFTRDPNDVYFINVSWTTKQFVGVSLNRTLDLILKEMAES